MYKLYNELGNIQMINNQQCKKCTSIWSCQTEVLITPICYLHSCVCAITTMYMLRVHDCLVLNANKSTSVSNDIFVKILLWQYNYIFLFIFNTYSIQISVFNHQVDRIFFSSPRFFLIKLSFISSSFQHLCLFHFKHT